MNNEEFQNFVEKCCQELEQKQSVLIKEFIGDYDLVEIDYKRGIVEFKKYSVVKSVSQITPIGSYSKIGSLWMWAWGNPSIPDVLKQKSEQIKELGSITGLEIFNKTAFAAEQEMTWEIIAMACHQLKSIGFCRPDTGGDDWLFVALDDVQNLN